MSTAYLRAKIEERATLSDAATALLDKAAADNRDPNAEERAQLDGWETRCKALDAEISRLEATTRGNAQFLKIAGRAREEEAAEREAAERRNTNKDKSENRGVSFGKRFVDSEQFKDYNGRGSMAPVEFEGFLERRAAITTADLPIDTYVFQGPTYVTTTPLLDVLGREVVTSGAVEYITWGNSDPMAAEVAEGEVKPEADIVPTENTVNLKTYAHWKGITRQALEDWPRIQSIVEGKLRGGLADALEAAAMGVLTGATWDPITGTDLLSGIRVAIGEIQSEGLNPNAVLLNPADYAALDIEAAANANTGPTSYGTFWGLRPVPAGTVPQGTVYVGDFAEGLTWFDRNTAAVYMTDSHADYFVRNLLVILAEQRAAFALTDPNAIRQVTTTAPGALSTTAAKAK